MTHILTDYHCYLRFCQYLSEHLKITQTNNKHYKVALLECNVLSSLIIVVLINIDIPVLMISRTMKPVSVQLQHSANPVLKKL